MGTKLRFCLRTFLFLLPTSMAAIGYAQPPPNKDALHAAWDALRERHKSVSSARARWTHEEVLSPRHVGIASSPEGGPPKSEMRFGPFEPTLVFAGDRLRYETLVASFVPETYGKMHPSDSTYDGVRQYRLSHSSDADGRKTGSLRTRAAAEEWIGEAVFPLTMALQPLRPELLGEDPDRWRPRNERVVVGGRPCLVLERGGTRPNDAKHTVYVDPERGFRICRYQVSLDEHVATLTEIEYASADAWIPSGWRLDRYFKDGGLSRTSVGSNVRVVLNEPIPDSEFRIEFPAGTILYDNGPEPFLVQEGGALIPLADAKLSKRRLPWLEVAALAALVVSIIGWRRHRRREVRLQ